MPAAFVSYARTSQPAFSGRVVIALNDDLKRAELGARLRELGLEVTVARNGQELQLAALCESRELLLVDMDNVGFGGAVAGLRATGYRGLIIALAEQPWPDTLLRCQQAGCDQMLDPDTALLELRLQLRAWLETPRVRGPNPGAVVDHSLRARFGGWLRRRGWLGRDAAVRA